MNIESITDDNLNYLTILHQKEAKKDLIFAALEFCAKQKYGENNKEAQNFIENLSNENFLIAHIENLLKTSMFFIWCCECDDKTFEINKELFLGQTLHLKKKMPTIFQFRLFYMENNEKIAGHIEKLNEAKKMRYFRRLEPIINYLKNI